ncbi:MAG: MFS transporter [Anaerolineae bacterium]|jgi:MFS family permease|nr:MFS transporter [Anaerolineae bacterium]MBT3713383.1 MFS transporter [Anaerolineae bacterium]MBT4309485.1 MFS transporter [Anaerolineae bacterium]MBT4459475.1 MFS transporter [Anaerolineae bacterium]MBT4842399.1 MFS transporter [Anaerolineae bacterium]
MGLGILATNIVRPILPLYLASIGVSPEVLGLMFSVAMAGMMFGEVSWGWVADKIGIKLPLSVGTTIFGLITLLFAYTQNIPSLFIVFLFWGFTRSALFGPSRGYIGAAASPSKKAASMAIIVVLLSASRTLGALPSGFIVDTWGYRFVFFVACGVALIGGSVLLIGLRQTRWVILKPITTSPSLANRTSFKNAISICRPLAPQCLVASLFFLGFGIVGTFLPLLAAQVVGGISVTEVGFLFAASGFVSMVLGISLGRLADRAGKKKIMILGMLISGIALIGMAFATNYLWLIVVTVSQSMGMAMFSSASMGLLSDSVSSQRQSTAMGAYGGLCEDPGIIIGSALGGFIWSAWGPQATFLTGAIAAGLGVVVSLVFIKESR